MKSRRGWTVPAAGIVVLVGSCIAVGQHQPPPVVALSYFDSPEPWVIAHRGGMAVWPENTLVAFEGSARLGVDVIEMDVRRSRDGHLVVIHDATVDRTTDGAGRVDALSLAELQGLDAGYRWSPANSNVFPYRGRGVQIPTLEAVLERLPQRINLELKEAGLTEQVCTALRRHGAQHRTLVASFALAPLTRFRRLCPEVATSASFSETVRFQLLRALGWSGHFSTSIHALQVPPRQGPLPLVTEAFVAAARRRNLAVHVWTINDLDTARALLAVGVAGLMTDDPEPVLELRAAMAKPGSFRRAPAPPLE